MHDTVLYIRDIVLYMCEIVLYMLAYTRYTSSYKDDDDDLESPCGTRVSSIVASISHRASLQLIMFSAHCRETGH